MAVLADLHKSISEMTDEELHEAFRTVRLARQTGSSKKKPKTKAKKKAKTIPPISTLSADLAKQLLSQLDPKLRQ